MSNELISFVNTLGGTYSSPSVSSASPTSEYANGIIDFRSLRSGLEILLETRRKYGWNNKETYSPYCWKVLPQEWSYPKECNYLACISKLSNSGNLSQKFHKILNQDKNLDVTEPINVNENFAISLFAGIVEIAATRKYHTDCIYGKELELQSYKDVPSCKFYMKIDGQVIWKKIGFSSQSGSWLDFLQDIFNISALDALATLAYALKMDFSKLVRMTSSTHHTTVDKEYRLWSWNIPKSLQMSFQTADKNIAVLEKITPILGYSGQTISAIINYKVGDNNIYLPAMCVEGELSIGKYAPTMHFFNQDKLDKYRNVPVILFQDLSVAIKLQEILGKTINQLEFIITGHLGKDLSLLPWNFLYGHDVIIVPKPDELSLASVKSYFSYCQDNRIGAFRVATKFLLQGREKTIGEDKLSQFSEAEKRILENCIWVGDENYPQIVLRNLIEEAVPFKNFEQHWKKLRVFKDNDYKQIETRISGLPPVPAELKPVRATKINDVNIFHIIRFGANIMLLGMKNAGKTQISYIFIRSFLGASNLPWPFSMNQTPSVGNVCIVDGETPRDEIVANLIQHGLAKELDKRLFIFSTLENNNYSIKTEESRENLLQSLIAKNCRLLILDNMKALMGDKVSQPDAVQKVFDWMRKLQGMDICILYVLHKDEDAPKTSKDKNKGVATLREMARCIVNIFGAAEIVAYNMGSEEVQRLAKKGGLTCGIQFSTCKAAPCIEKWILWLHLPFDSGEWQIICVTDGNGNEIDPQEINPSNGRKTNIEEELPEFEDTNKIVHDALKISKGAQSVYSAMKTFSNGECSISQLEEKFSGEKGMGRDTLRDKYLKELMQTGIVERIGDNSRDTKYRIIQ